MCAPMQREFQIVTVGIDQNGDEVSRTSERLALWLLLNRDGTKRLAAASYAHACEPGVV